MTQRTTLVNVRKQVCDVYIGRPSPFGNPHAIGFCGLCRKSHDRREAIAKFREDFKQSLIGGRQAKLWKDQLSELKGKVLGCYCAPNLPCHGEVLVEYLEQEGEFAPGAQKPLVFNCRIRSYEK